MFAYFILLLNFLTSFSYALEPQFRQVRTVEGRDFACEILATMETGLEVRSRQGEELIPFESLMDIAPVTQEEFLAESPVKIWLKSTEDIPQLREVFAHIPHTTLATEQELGDVRSCGIDIACMRQHTSGAAQWQWIVIAHPPQDDTQAALILRSGTSHGNTMPTVTPSPSIDLHDLSEGAQKALGLNPVDLGFSRPVTIASTRPLRYTAFTPIPGYTALRKQKNGAFVASIATALVASGGAAYIASHDKPRPARSTGSALGTFYLVAIASNHLFARSK